MQLFPVILDGDKKGTVLFSGLIPKLLSFMHEHVEIEII